MEKKLEELSLKELQESYYQICAKIGEKIYLAFLNSKEQTTLCEQILMLNQRADQLKKETENASA